jgi:Domain of unknown function (DUF1707)
MPEPHLRAADTDRAAVATVLGQHMSAGRLTVDEYDERLARAYAAKTYGELAELTADLPGTTTHAPASVPAPRSPAPAVDCSAWGSPWAGHWGRQGSPQWRSWLSTALIVVSIWAVTSLASWELNYFWPIWVIGPWGAILLAQSITGGGHHGRDRNRNRQLH